MRGREVLEREPQRQRRQRAHAPGGGLAFLSGNVGRQEISPQETPEPEGGRGKAANLRSIVAEEPVNQGHAPVVKRRLLEKRRAVQGRHRPSSLGDLPCHGPHTRLIRRPEVMTQDSEGVKEDQEDGHGPRGRIHAFGLAAHGHESLRTGLRPMQRRTPLARRGRRGLHQLPKRNG